MDVFPNDHSEGLSYERAAEPSLTGMRVRRAIPLVHLLISFITLLVLVFVVSEAKQELSEAGTTMRGVASLVPEMRDSLTILDNICATIAKPYCGI
jgi:hypothetical protein